MTSQVQGFRLSPQQGRLWRLLRSAGGPRFAQAVVRLAGAVDPEALERALAEVAGRHQILRTGFRRSPGMPEPIQLPAPTASPALRRIEGGGLDDLRRRERERVSDLEGGEVLQAALARPDQDDPVLVLTLPALCADRASLESLVRELAASVARSGEAGEGEEPVQYVQFSEWQHEVLEEGSPATAAEPAPADRARRLPVAARPEASSEPAEPAPFELRAEGEVLDSGSVEAARTLAERCGVPVAVAVAAAWHLLLRRRGDGAVPVVGHVLAGRYEGLEEVLGPLAKVAPVTLPTDAGLRFEDLAVRLAGELSVAEESLDIRDPRIGADGDEGERGWAFGFEAVPGAGSAAGDGFVIVDLDAPADRIELALEVPEDEIGAAVLRYAPSVYREISVSRIAAGLRRLLADAAARPDAPVAELDAVGEEELRFLLDEWNRTGGPADGGSFPERFAEWVRSTPDAPAVIAGDRTLSYDELAAEAGRVAAGLRALGAGPEQTVALYLDRTPEMVIALLGALEAGAAYLPLDVATPPERLELLLADAAPRAVLTTTRWAPELPSSAASVLRLDVAEDWPEAGGGGDPDAVPAPESLVYVMYTSGSTGRPKGVMVPHGALGHYLAWAVDRYRPADGETVPVHSPLSFDLTVTSLLAPLAAGGSVTLLPEEDGLQALDRALSGGGDYSLVKLTPAHLDLLRHGGGGAAGARAARLFVIGGEALRGESVAFLAERDSETRVINEYGPTETVVGCCCHELPAGSRPEGAVPIGRPITGTRLYVVDRSLRPVAAGVTGELLIGGGGLSRGYRGAPALTAERFVPDPWSDRRGEPGARLYRSGDLVRLGPDDLLEFVGRNDAQLKIRGIRVEPAEIEAVLAEHPAIRSAAVATQPTPDGDRRLVAYLVASGQELPGVDELRGFLVPRLPDYMIPVAFVPVPSIPLTAHGKVDRRALPELGETHAALEREYVAPRTPLEETLAEVMASCLGVERVGAHDNFFVLGGDSMRSVRAVALAMERGIELTVQEFFSHPSVAELAELVEARGGAPAGEPTEGAGMQELLDEVEGMSEEEVRRLLAERTETKETVEQ